MTEMLQHWVSGAAQRRPNAAAVILGEERLSYGELETLSNQLARALRERHCIRGDRVALLMPKSPLAMVCLLGIYKADCIAVPLEPAAPATSLARVLAASEARCLLAAASLAPRVRELLSQPAVPTLRIGWLGTPDPAEGILPVEFHFADIGVLSGTPVAGAHRGQDPAHILFDWSGDAARGTVTTHANLTACVDWVREHFRLNETDRLSCHAPLTSNLSFLDIFGAFAATAELHLVPAETHGLPGRLAAWMRTSRITQWSSSAAVLHHFAVFDAIQPWDFPELRRVLWSGGHPAVSSLSYWMKQLPHVQFTGFYGHPEMALASGHHTVETFPHDGEELPLGQARTGQDILLLDQNLQPVTAGTTGDIYVRGSGLSPGYWRDAQATSRAFPVLDGLGRVYRTGERGWRDPSGHIFAAAVGQAIATAPPPSGETTEDDRGLQGARPWRAWEERMDKAKAAMRQEDR